MGMFDFVTKPLNKIVDEVKRAPKNIAEAPKKIVRETGKGVEGIIQAPKRLIEGTGRVAENVGSSLGSAGGNLVGNILGGSAQGLGQVADALVPAAQKILNPQEYMDRKSDFTTQPIITTQAAPAKNDNMFLVIGIISVLFLGTFLFLRKRK